MDKQKPPARPRRSGRASPLPAVSRSIHAGAGNLSPDAFKLSLGRLYNRTKKAVGGQIPGSRVGQIDPPSSTAAKLAAEHSALRLVEVPCLALQHPRYGLRADRVALGPETGKPALQ